MSWLRALSPRVEGKHFRHRPLAVWAVAVVVALFTGLLSLLPVLTPTPAHAAVSHVQSTGNWAASSASSITQAFGSNNTAGNTIIVTATWSDLGGMYCTDSNGNSYTTVSTYRDSTNTQNLGVCYATNVAAGANTVTVTFDNNRTNRGIIIAEYSGIATSNAVDMVNVNLATGTTSTDNVTSSSASTTSDGDLIFGAVIDTTTATSIAAGTGFAERHSINSESLQIEDQTQSAAGSIAATWTLGAARPYIGLMVAFRPAGTSPAAPTSPVNVGDGITSYGAYNVVSRWRSYDGTANTFGAAVPTNADNNQNLSVVRTSPTKREAIAATATNNGILTVSCFDGTSWRNEWSVVVGGTGENKRFDVAYETATGDVVVLYSRDVSSTNEMAYRTKAGTSNCGTSNWSGATNLDPVRSSGQVQWIRMAWDRRATSNLITAIWADSNSDLSAMVWSGTAWGNEYTSALETSLETVAGTFAVNVADFDVEYESGGDVMVVWANSAGNDGTNGVRYATCTGGTSSCTWSGAQTPPTFLDDATNLDISASPASDEIVFASIGDAGSDLQIGYWSGTTWTNTANVDTGAQAPAAGTQLVATGWLTGVTQRSIVVYHQSGTTNVGWYVGAGSTFTLQTDYAASPAFANPQKYYEIQTNPVLTDRLMLGVADSNSDYFSKRLVMTAPGSFSWSAADSAAALEVGLDTPTVQPFSFAYWRNVSRPSLTQNGYIFENDNEDQATGDAFDENTQQAAGNTPLTGVKKGERITARFQASNSGAPLESDLGLFYDRNDGIWSKVNSATKTTTAAGNCDDVNFSCGAAFSTNQGITQFAFDAFGVPMAAYNYFQDVYFAKYVGSGGTGCISLTWTCTQVTSTFQITDELSIAFDKTGAPWISYYNGTSDDLWVARYVGSGGTGCYSSDWTCTQIDTTGDVGAVSSIAFDAAGNPWIAYQDATNDYLRVARYVGSNGTGCASSAWLCTSVMTTNAGDLRVSEIDFDPAGTPWIIAANTTNNDLYIARYVRGGGSGCVASTWTCTLIDSSPTTLNSASMAIDQNGIPWIAYAKDYETVMSARYVGSGGSGCTSSAWTCTTIDIDVGADRGYGLSMEIDPAGNPWMTHIHTDNHAVELTRYTGSGGTGCSNSSAWTCSTIDDTSGIEDSTPGTAIRFDANGQPWISYYNDNDGFRYFARLNRAGEITMSPSLAAGAGDPLRESHTDMSSTGDTANRDDADCTTAGAYFNNGKFIESENGQNIALPGGVGTTQCTELSFELDTSGTTAGTTYRFVLASKDAFRPDSAMWRGLSAVTNYATITIESTTRTRVSKDTQYDLSNCADTAWGCGIIDSNNSVGSYASMAFDQSGIPWVSYLDGTSGDLRVARYVVSGGTGCASSAWTCTSIDTNNNVGLATSIAIDQSGNPWISYYDDTNDDLRVAHYVGTGGTGCAVTTWTCTAVDTANNVGFDNEIVIDGMNGAWVEYYDTTNGQVRVAHYVGTGGTGCAVTTWTCIVFDTANNSATYVHSSIALDNAGNPWISYPNYTGGDLRVAHYVGTGGMGCTSTAWTCTSVDTATSTGYWTSIGFDSTGAAWVGYNDNSTHDLRVAKYVGSGGTGCATTEWACTSVDTSNNVGVDTSIAFDAAGNPWVAFHDYSNLDLRVARYVGSGGSGCATSAWTCSSVETSNDVGHHNSIAFDFSGTPWIVHNDNTNFDLRVAKMHLPPTQPSYVGHYPTFGRNAVHGDARYRLDSTGDTAVSTANSSYDTATATSSEIPLYVAAKQTSSITAFPSMTWTGQSSVAFTTRAATVQVWNNTTKAWATPATVSNGCSATGANTNCTITATPSGTISDYYETDSSTYWAYFRVYQALGSAETLRTDQFSISTSAAGTKSELAQTGYIFENDNGTPDTNTQQAAGNTAITSVQKGERVTLRAQLDNDASAQSANLGLFYDRNDGIWTQVGGPNTPVTGSGSCASISFDCTTVDSSNLVGNESSMALDQAGTPWISYYDDTNDDLRVAHYVGTGGTGCATATWMCVTVESTNNTGRYTSIAIDPTGAPWISYQEATNGDLRVARFVGSGGTGCAITSWTCVTVDSTNVTGLQTTIGFDPSGVAWVGYYDDTADDLRVAKYVSSGGTGCAIAAWNCTSVDTTNDAGSNPSIAFDSAGNPWLSYQYATGTDIRVAQYVGSGGSGCASSAWTCSAIDTNNSVGLFSSIAFDPAGNPWVAYHDLTNSGLRVARFTGSNGTGCTLSAWTCTAVDTANNVGQQVSIAFDPSGAPWITHYDFTNDDLRVARYVGSGGSGCAISSWTCGALDSAPLTGQSSSLAFDAAGNAVVSFYETTANDLRFAKLRRGGELFVASGLAGTSGDALSESHVDMSSTSDTSNRDDSDCSATASVWNNGKWYESVEASGLSLPAGHFSPQCTEVSFVIDTSQATANTTYRFVIASKDGWRKDKGPWRGMVSINNYPTLSIESATTLRIAKDAQLISSNCSDTSWGCESIDTSNSNGRDSAVAIDAAGNPWIAYIDVTNGNLLSARYVGSGGTGCATTAWTCTSVDTTNDAGHSPAIAIDSAGNAWISYFDNTSGDLQVARYVGSGGSGCTSSAWTCDLVDDIGNPGRMSSIAFDPSGNAWISYWNSDDADLKVARYVGSGGSGCNISSWTCVVVESTGNVGYGTSLAFDVAGNPWVAYYDAGNGNSRVAQYVGTGGTGCAIASWKCTTVESSNDVGNAPSIAIDSSNNVWVSHYDMTNGNLRVSKYVGSGGSGCASSAWTCTAVETTNDVGNFSSIAIDAAGNPWVSYIDSTTTSMRVARYVGSSGSGCASSAWTCTSVDTGDGSGWATRAAFDKSGALWVSYMDASSSNLKVAHLHRSPTPLSYQSRHAYFTNGATDGDARYRVDASGKAAIGTDDSTYDTSVAVANEAPIYTFAARSASNSSFPNYYWIGRSTVAASTKNAKIEVYRFGSTNAWTTLQTNSTTAANTDITLTGTASAGSASEYWEADGSNYWAYYRVYQDANTSGATVSSDYFGVVVNTAPTAPSSLAQKTTGDVVLSTGQWHNATSVKFTATIADSNVFDTDQLCVEAKALGQAFANTENSCGTGVAYSGTGVSASVTLTLSDATEYHWQARVKDAAGLYSSWVSYGANAESARDVGIDTTAPTGGTVYDGTNAGVDSTYNTGSITQLSANWSGISSNVSGLSSYEYSIGTTPGGTTVKTWTSNGTTTSVTASGLTLQTSQIYYINVRTTDNAGNVSSVVSSNGQYVAPTVTLDLSTTTIDFNNLNPANSFTDTETLDATVTTNAHNGYTLSQYSTDLLTYVSTTIPMYSGTWASPTSWTGAGFGYTSSDTNVSGSNRFSNGSHYAGFGTGAPGDVVADSSTTAVSGDIYTLTYKLVVPTTQTMGTYTTSLVIGATANF